MATPFRFEPILGWVEQREEEESRRLAAVAREEREARDALEALEREREREWARFAAGNAPFDAETYRVALAYIEHLTEHIDAQQVTVEEARTRVAAARDVLLETVKERQSYEHLRDRHAADQAREENRREASQQDDITTSRYVRGLTSDGLGAA